MAQIVTQQSVLDLINGSMCLDSNLFEPHPNQDRTADMIANNSCLATLISFNASQLFGLTVKLLDFPAEATHILYDLHVVLLHLIRDDVIRVRWVDSTTRKSFTL